MNTFKRGDAIFVQGQPSGKAYRITSGIVKLVRTSDRRAEAIIAFRATGQILGEDALHTHHTSDAIVISDSCELEPQPVESIQMSEVLDQYRHLAYKTELLVLHDLEYRAKYHLSEPAKLMGSALPITQLELAQYVGATRETTSTLLNKLEREGLVKLRRRSITVLPKKKR